jgi:hypothetical protein
VVGSRMTAPVAQRRVVAPRANFQGLSRPLKLIAAVPAQSEHTACIGLDRGTALASGRDAWLSGAAAAVLLWAG